MTSCALVLAVAGPLALLGRGTASSGAPLVPAARQAPVSSTQCEHAVEAQLQDVLGRVLSGTVPPSAAALDDRSAQALTDVLATATSDLLGPFHRDVAAEVDAYRPRIAAACRG